MVTHIWMNTTLLSTVKRWKMTRMTLCGRPSWKNSIAGRWRIGKGRLTDPYSVLEIHNYKHCHHRKRSRSWSGHASSTYAPAFQLTEAFVTMRFFALSWPLCCQILWWLVMFVWVYLNNKRCVLLRYSNGVTEYSITVSFFTLSRKNYNPLVLCYTKFHNITKCQFLQGLDSLQH